MADQLKVGGPSRVLLVASAPVQLHAQFGMPKLALARDVEFGGAGRIWGTTKTKGAVGAPDVPTIDPALINLNF